jgi:hypothetical protein
MEEFNKKNFLNERNLEIRIMIPDGVGTGTFIQTEPAGTHTEKRLYAYRQTCQTSHIRPCWPSFIAYFPYFEKIKEAYEITLLSVCLYVPSEEAGILESEQTDVAGQLLTEHVPTSANTFESVKRSSELATN